MTIFNKILFDLANTNVLHNLFSWWLSEFLSFERKYTDFATTQMILV